MQLFIGTINTNFLPTCGLYSSYDATVQLLCNYNVLTSSMFAEDQRNLEHLFDTSIFNRTVSYHVATKCIEIIKM